MTYTFNGSENKITKLLPAYIFNYSYDNGKGDDGKGLFLFIKYLTNYIETANEALDKICSELNVNSSNTYILDILAKKLGVEIPTTITSVEDKQTVLKGKIMTISSTGCAQALIDTIYGLYPDWHNYDSFGTPIEVGNTIYKLFCNTTETPNISELGWDNADETTTTTDIDGFETVTKILNVLVSTTGPVVQLVQKTSNGLEGYSVIVHYTTEEDNVNVISYKDKNTCDIEDLVDSNNMVTAISPEIDEIRSFIASQKTFYAISNNTYNYPDVKDMYYNSYRTIKYTTNWKNYTWQNLPNDISKGDIWQDNDGNIYASNQGLQCKLNKQTFTWEPMFWKGLTSFYRQGIWTDGEKIYYSYEDENNNQLNYELENNYTWIPKTWYGLDTLLSDGGYFRGGDVWSDGEKMYCSTQFILSGGTTKYYNYVLKPDTSTWSLQTWQGLTNIQTSKLFYYKEQVLYCDGTTYYTLNIGTNNWESHMWPDKIDISAKYIWSDGSDYYYLSSYGERYKLNQTSFTWEPITWTGLDDISNPTGQLIWHFDNNVFYGFTKRLVTVNSDKVIVDRKRLNNNYQKVFTTPEIGNDGDFQREIFYDLSGTSTPFKDNTIDGRYIWKNSKGTIYYNNFILSAFFYRQTRQFENKTWEVPEGTKLQSGRDIYNIDNTTYYTYSENDTVTPINLQLVTDSVWVNKQWGTSDIREGRKVWKTKDNIYYGNTYKFIDKYDFNFKLWKGLEGAGVDSFIKGRYIWEFDDNIYYSNNTEQYRLVKHTSTWTSISWPGYNKIIGSYIWKTKNNIYYSYQDDHYILKIYPDSHVNWEQVTWPGLTTFDGDHIWSDGNNTYYSDVDVISGSLISRQYKLNEQLLKWEPITWNGYNNISGENICTINNSIYYLAMNNVCYKINTESLTCEKVSLFVGSPVDVYGKHIWHDGSDTYYSFYSEQYKFNNVTGKFEKITWLSRPELGIDIWHYGTDTYYSTNAEKEFADTEVKNSKLEYIKLPTSITWSNVPDNFDPVNIWHIGDITYYSQGETHKIINEDTMSFDNFTEWKGLDNFSGEYIWKSNNNVYYTSPEIGTYILDIGTHTWSPKSWVSNHIKDNSEINTGNYIWSDGIRTYYSNNYVLNDYTDSVSVDCSFTDNKLSVKSQLTRKYTVNPLYYSIRLQSPSYALDMIKLPNNLLGWHSPDGIESPVIEVAIINNVTDKVPTSFEIIREKYQNEWGRYIDKDDDFNPIINKAVSVIDTSSLLQGAQNMHYEVIIGGVDKDGNPGPNLTASQKDIITKYLIPKFLGVSYEVKFKQ